MSHAPRIQVAAATAERIADKGRRELLGMLEDLLRQPNRVTEFGFGDVGFFGRGESDAVTLPPRAPDESRFLSAILNK
jgi:hypothetical protein